MERPAGARLAMLTYLAGPYSHRDPDVVEARVEALAQAAAHLDRRGRLVLAPVLHWHDVCRRTGLSGTWGSRRRWCLTTLAACHDLVLLTLDGWRDSEGVAAELDEAARLMRAIEWLRPEEVE